MASPGPLVEERYTRLAHYVRKALPNVPTSKPRVWRAFLKWSQLPERLALAAVSPGRGPIVGITAAENVNGVFRPKTPRVVFLHARVASAFQRNLRGSRLLVESTLLHELVHWGNYISQYALDSRKLQSRQGSDGRRRGGYTNVGGSLREVGKQFERQAYGRDVNFRNMTRAAARCGTCGS